MTGEPHAGPRRAPGQPAAGQRLLRARPPRGRGPHDRAAAGRPAGVLVDRARPADEPRPCARRLDPEPGRGPVRDRPRLRRPRARQGPVAVPPDRRARPVRARRVPERHHARELAADRLHRRAGARRPRRGRPRAQPALPALDADGRASRAAAARRRRRRHARRPRQGAVRARGAADRARCARWSSRTSRSTCAARTAPRRSPTPSGSATTGSTCIPSTGGDPYIDIACCPFQLPLSRADPAAAREPDRRRQVPRHHAHHQRRLPPAPGRVERRRGGRPPRRVLRRRRRPAARGRRAAGAARPLPGASWTAPGSSAPGRRRSGAGIPDGRRASSPECASSSPPAGAPATSGR